MLNTYLVKQINRYYHKSVGSGVVLQNTSYVVNDVLEIPAIVTGISITPSIFELNLSDEFEEVDQREIVSQVSFTLETISIKNHELDSCPICGGPITIINNHVVCLNIDCFNSRDSVRTRLVHIFPHIPIEHIFKFADYYSDHYPGNFNISSIIEHVLFLTSPEKEFKTIINDMQESFQRLTIEHLFGATIGLPLPNDIVFVIKKYNNELISMIADESNDFQKIKGISDNAISLCKSLIDANQRLIDLYYQLRE